MLPTAISVSFRNAATSETASSGALVPKAMTVRPMRWSLQPHDSARSFAPASPRLGAEVEQHRTRDDHGEHDGRMSPEGLQLGRGRGHGGALLGAVHLDAVDEEDDEAGGDRQEDRAVEPAEDAVAGEERERERREQHDRVLDHEGAALHPYRVDHRARPQDRADVEDVGAEDSADGDATGAADGVGDADHELRQRRADGDDGEADDRGRHPQLEGERHGAPYEGFGAEDQHGQTEDDEQPVRHASRTPKGVRGGVRNRTGLDGFAIRCLTIRPRHRGIVDVDEAGIIGACNSPSTIAAPSAGRARRPPRPPRRHRVACRRSPAAPPRPSSPSPSAWPPRRSA